MYAKYKGCLITIYLTTATVFLHEDIDMALVRVGGSSLVTKVNFIFHSAIFQTHNTRVT